MQQRPSLSPETLAAQALGEADPVSGALTPAIHPATNYEQQPDGAYRQDRVYTRADNPTYEHAEGLLAALEGAGCACGLVVPRAEGARRVYRLDPDGVAVLRAWLDRIWEQESTSLSSPGGGDGAGAFGGKACRPAGQACHLAHPLAGGIVLVLAAAHPIASLPDWAGASMTEQRRTIYQVLADARARYRRLEPAEAFAAMQAGAVLIDTRTDRQRGRDGDIPGAVVIDRTVLEWRVDPASGSRHPAIASLEVPLILLCAQGYSSSLAAASLLDLGAREVSDVIGGFEAWRTAGLPVGPLGARPPDEGADGTTG